MRRGAFAPERIEIPKGKAEPAFPFFYWSGGMTR